MNPAWRVITGRLVLSPVGWNFAHEIAALKGDPLVYGQMLGGVRGAVQMAAELAEEAVFWSRHGAGMWIAHPAAGGAAVGLTGVHERTDGRGIALRFAFTPAVRGQGLAREAAGAALRFAHGRGGIPRVVAVAKDSNIGSRTVLGAIGMRECDRFHRGGEEMVMYESLDGSPYTGSGPGGWR